jgi:uncharacterized protein (TIRG00374 family)
MKKVSCYFMTKIVKKIKYIAPWCIAAAIFAYMFREYPPSQLWHALKFVNVPAFAALVLCYFLLMYLVDAFCMQRVISRFSHAVTFKDIFIARGVTYLIMTINYPASQAAFAYYLKRKYGIAIMQALGIFIFIMFVDLFFLITLALVGSLFLDSKIVGIELAHTVRIVAVIAYACAFAWLAFWRKLPERIFGKNFSNALFDKLRKRNVFHIFEMAKTTDYLKIALMRSPIHLAIALFMYFVFATFGTHVPIAQILANVPIVFLIGTLPITPGGLGTVNAAMVALLYPFVTGDAVDSARISPQELVFTATILWMFANFVMKAFTGSILLRKISKDLFKPIPDVPRELVEREAAHLGGDF